MSEKPHIMLPMGVARYPALHMPDTKFVEFGEYKADVVVPAEKAKPIMKKLQEVAKEHTGKPLAKSKNSCWEAVIDDDGEETGEIMFKVRVKNKMSRKTGKLWDRRPMVIDGQKNPISTDVAVGGGSKLKVQAEIDAWEAANKRGVSLRPLIVQVVDLKTWQKGDLDAFDEIDDDYGEDQSGDYDDNQYGDDDDY
ncbi:hypothetical protein [Maritalea mediterranea]|uniref:DUF2815 family protein n=1 Tax=Maritalea mediterranea TaxID=2909667 RepID=A0ABS9EA95_9HYPH|nr:hypothetical protein [Maritalea mediterranea]MCF4099807.1 hypothetical protein [Maritalea mediterranea]